MLCGDLSPFEDAFQLPQFRQERLPVVLHGPALRPISSIDRRIFSTFSPETIVMPGHGDDTTIGTELPSFGEWIERGW